VHHSAIRNLYARRHIFTGWKSLRGAAALDGLDDLLDDAGVGESGDVSQRVLLASKNLPQDSAHDLAGPGLGQVGDDDDRLWRGEGADALADLEDQILLQLVVDLVSVLDGDESVDSLAGKVVSHANDGSLGDGVVLNERGLDLGSGQTVTGDVDDIVDTSADPVVTVVVTSCSISGELDRG
jgi:hypothetical protein